MPGEKDQDKEVLDERDEETDDEDRDDLDEEGEDEDETDKAGDDADVDADGDDKDGEEPPPKKTEWDADRQRRDQEHAAERRAWEADRRELAETVAALKARLDDLGTKKPADDEQVKIDAAIEALSDASDPAELVGAVKQLHRLLRGESGVGRGMAALVNEVKTLAKRVETRERAEAQAERRSLMMKTLDTCDAEYGEGLRLKAFQAADAALVELGYSPENPPPPDLMQAQIELAYSRLARATKDPKPKKNPPASDAGSGGRPGSAAKKTGTIEEVAELMARGM